MRYPTDEELQAFYEYLDSDERGHDDESDPERARLEAWRRKDTEDFKQFLNSDLAKIALQLD